MHLSERTDHHLRFPGGEPRIDRQRDRVPECLLRARESRQVQRSVDRLEHGVARRDPEGGQPTDHPARALGARDDEAVIHMRPSIVAGGQPDGKSTPGPTIAGGQSGAPGQHGGQAAELASAQRGLKIGELVVEAQSVPAALVVIAAVPDSRQQASIPAEHHPAFPGRQELRRIEGEHADDADRTDGTASIAGAECLGAVLDEGNAQIEQGVQVGRESEQMRDDDRPGAFGEPPPHICRVEGVVAGIDVGQPRSRAHILDRMQRGNTHVAGQNDLVPGLDPQGEQRQMERRRSGTHGDAGG
jgi:hypothetical protein